MSRTETKSTKVNWVVELYPFNETYPGAEVDNTVSPAPSVVLGANATTESYIQSIYKQKTEGVQDPKVALGLTHLNIQRSKTDPSSRCTFSIKGTTPPGAFPGTWVIVTSITVDGRGVEKRLVRFIGQIARMQTKYVVNESGVREKTTQYDVREWSSVLETPVRYDIFAIVQAQQKQNFASATSVIQKAFNDAGKDVSIEEMREVIQRSLKPFQLAQTFLQFVGALNQNDRLNSLEGIERLELPEVALTMPSIPANFLKRLGVDATSETTRNVFQSGLVNVITGVQTEGVNNTGKWGGIFTPSDASSPSINEFKTGSFKADLENRPLSLGLLSLTSGGDSAWQLITNHCDPSLNEFFTDMLYERGAEDGSIIAKPAIFVRDKPFLLKKLADSAEVDLVDWTFYDDIPRVRLDSAYITSFTLSNTFMDSPNFLRVNYHPQFLNPQAAKAISQLEGTQRLTPQMRRYGGQEFFIETQFLNPDSSVDLRQWFAEIGEVGKLWHSFRYKMGRGMINLIEDNFPITVGFNLQFKMGEFDLVGHVESVSTQFQVGPAGEMITRTQVQLTRLVHQDPDTGELDFIAPEAFTDLFDTRNASAPADSSTIPSFSEVASSVDDFVDFNTSFGPRS